jgi:hypothetical protein
MNRTPALALAAVFALSAGAAMARDDMKPAKTEMEKCYGVAKAGQNDCKAGAGTSVRGHLQGRLPGRRLEEGRQGHLHQHQDPDRHGLADPEGDSRYVVIPDERVSASSGTDPARFRRSRIALGSASSGMTS